MELCNGGDLSHLKNAKGRFKENEARLILQQLVNGFKEIYKQQVMHRDVKLANILIHFTGDQEKFTLRQIEQEPNPAEREAKLIKFLKEVDLTKVPFQIKIADLGFARELDYEDLTQTHCGTPIVMAPEVLNNKRYNHKADVWSLGIIFYEMITGFMPFNGNNKRELAENLKKGEYKFPKKLMISLQGLHFLNCCLQSNTEFRLNWSQLTSHEYIDVSPSKDEQGLEGEELIYLTYCKTNDAYVRDDIYQHNKKIRKEGGDAGLEESNYMTFKNIHDLNAKNAILLNVNDNSAIEKIYKETQEKRLKSKSKDVLSN